MRAVMDMIVEHGREAGDRPFGVCGQDTAQWIVIDYVHVVIHLFDRPRRDYYDLELLWGDAPRIDWSESA